LNELKSLATDDERKSVSAYEGDKIRHMTKIWNAAWAMKELGWA
jgi:hypothetical protein